MFNFENNIICKMLGIKYPIIQAGMVWVSGAKLAAASSNAGILGVIGAGSMKPELLDEQLKKAKRLSTNPHAIAVNIPLLYKYVEDQIAICLENDIKIFITSAGSPSKYTAMLKEKGCTVIHVTSSPSLALKCQAAGVDAVIAEGFEAGGHNGRDEITTMCLIPQVVDALKIPVIAAGGIFDARTTLAAMCLGASGVQIGTRFVNSIESSAHQNFKNKIIQADAGDTKLLMKKYVPVRLLDNKFSQEIMELESKCEDIQKIKDHLGHGRAKLGMLEGDMQEGELEIGQCSASIRDIKSVSQIVDEIIFEINNFKLK